MLEGNPYYLALTMQQMSLSISRGELRGLAMQVLLEGNPYYLALTFAVSVLHSIFDMLAFKNDIGFWKDKKSVEGLSIKTILINCVCQVLFHLTWSAIVEPLLASS